MSTEQTQIIEINGVKMEVDLRRAKMVHDNIRVGSKVKVMVKGGYSGPEVHPGVVVGFEPFTELPTIVVAYIVQTYSDAKLEFAYINPSAKSAEKFSLIPSIDDDMPVNRKMAMDTFDREIKKHERSIEDIRDKRAYFEAHFGVYFAAAESASV